MTSLARETGWSPHHILWELPYPVGLQIECALLRSGGVWCVPIVPPPPPVTDAGLDALLTSAHSHE